MSTARGYADPIVTGEAVAIEIRPAGIASRGLALAVDVAIQFVVVLLVLLAIARFGSSIDDASGAAVFLVLMVAVLLGYPVAFETLWRGRTPGKAVLGLRVLRDDGGPIRFRHAFVRGLVGVVVDRPGLSSGLLALVPMLFSARSKRMGDLAAGTVVVQDRVPARVAPPPAMPPHLVAWASAVDLSGVTDDIALEARHFMARSAQLAPWAREQMGTRLVDELTRRTGPPPPGTAPWDYLAAVLAERTRREVARLTPVVPPAATAAARPPADTLPPRTTPAAHPDAARPSTDDSRRPGGFAPPV